jgi:hypothetical protein
MKKRKAPRAKSRFEKMSVHELAEATAAYGREMAVDQFGPMGVAARRRWEGARRKPGRPRRGRGAKVISVSVERELLSRSDRLARDLGVSRASLIERGLTTVLVLEHQIALGRLRDKDDPVISSAELRKRIGARKA